MDNREMVHRDRKEKEGGMTEGISKRTWFVALLEVVQAAPSILKPETKSLNHCLESVT